MGIGKIVKIGGEFQRVNLNEQERQGVLQKLVEENAQEFKRCVEMAKNINKDDFFNIAVVLFDKQGTSAYTVLTDALEEKIHAMRNMEAKELPPAPAPPKPEKVEATNIQEAKEANENIESDSEKNKNIAKEVFDKAYKEKSKTEPFKYEYGKEEPKGDASEQ